MFSSCCKGVKLSCTCLSLLWMFFYFSKQHIINLVSVWLHLLCASRICLPVSGKGKGTNEAQSLQMAGTESSPSVSPLTSETQLTEKLPVHTKSVLRALWRHRQHKLSTLPNPHLPHQSVNRACFKKRRERQRKYPKKSVQCAGEGGTSIYSRLSWGHHEVKHHPREDCSPDSRGRLGSISWTDHGLHQTATLNPLDLSVVF